MAAPLREIQAYLDRYLRISEVQDWSEAWNGLQIENSGAVTRIGAAVDAVETTIREAVDAGVTLLIVHHGLFWGGTKPITGAHYRKIKLAVEGDLAVYSAHLPLDLHPVVGNNAILCRALGFKKPERFFLEKGELIGLRARVRLNRAELIERVESAVGGRVHVCPGGPQRIREVGIVTGGAGAEVARAAADGIDTFITGEAPHWAYGVAEELGINLVLGGHYATETFGVKALAAHVSAKFKLPWVFLDHPTGL